MPRYVQIVFGLVGLLFGAMLAIAAMLDSTFPLRAIVIIFLSAMTLCYSWQLLSGNLPKPSSPRRDACCSFCGRPHKIAGPFAEGPKQVYICGKCADFCREIISQEIARKDSLANPEAQQE